MFSRSARVAVLSSLALLAAAPAAMAVGTTSDSDTSQVTAGVGEEISIVADDPSTLNLSHFATASASAAVSVTSTQPDWTVSARDIDAATPGKLDRTSGTGPSSLAESLGLTPANAALFALTGSYQTVFSGVANDSTTVSYSQDLATGEDAITGDTYAGTVEYSVVAGSAGNGGGGGNPQSSSFALVIGEALTGPSGMTGTLWTSDLSGASRTVVGSGVVASPSVAPTADYYLLTSGNSLTVRAIPSNNTVTSTDCGSLNLQSPRWMADGSAVTFQCSGPSGTTQKVLALDGSVSNDSVSASWCSYSRIGNNKFAYAPMSAPAQGAGAVFVSSSAPDMNNGCNPSGATSLISYPGTQQVTTGDKTAIWSPGFGQVNISPDGAKVMFMSNYQNTPSVSCMSWPGMGEFCSASAPYDLYVRNYDASGSNTRYQVGTESGGGLWAADSDHIYVSLSSANLSWKRFSTADSSSSTVSFTKEDPAGYFGLFGAKQ